MHHILGFQPSVECCCCIMSHLVSIQVGQVDTNADISVEKESNRLTETEYSSTATICMSYCIQFFVDKVTIFKLL